MKKNNLLSIAFACCYFLILSALPAQNWHPFPANRLLLYSFQQPGVPYQYYLAAHADSVRLEGADSAYYFYRICRTAIPSDTQVTCNGMQVNLLSSALLIDQDHYLGRKMLARPNGEFLFVSSRADSFSLHAHAAESDTWTWTVGVTATVDSVVMGTVLGVPDSLKYIHLSSGPQWILSRAHGLVQLTNLLPFAYYGPPMLDLQFDVWGIPDLGLGNRLPSYADIFQFAPNDKFGYTTTTNTHPLATKEYSNVTIQSQTPGSRFQYQVSKERLYMEDPYLGPNDTTYFAPAMTTISYDSLLYAPLTQLLPYEYSSPITGFIGTPIQTGVFALPEQNNRINLSYALQGEFDTCAQAYPATTAFGMMRLGVGIGQSYHVWHVDISSESKTLTCYEKGSETWDTCLVLGPPPTAVEPMHPTAAFGISPNPAADRLHIDFGTLPMRQQGQVTVLTLHGRIVQQQPLRAGQGHAELNVGDLPAGVYVLRLEANGSSLGHVRFVVVH